MTRVAFITHYCTHYRVRTYEEFARRFDTDFFFYSAGDEWYWQRQHGVQHGNFRHRYLRGFRIGGTRVTPTLLPQLLAGQYDVYVKCINGRFALPLSYLAARLRRKPFILWTGIWQRLGTPAHRLFFPLTRWFYRHADAVVVYGDHVRRYLISEGVTPSRIFTAHHAVDNAAYNQTLPEAERRTILAQHAIDAGTPIVLYLGRLAVGKGLEDLIDSLARLQDQRAVLLLAGDGELRAALEHRAAALGISARVRFAGYIPTDDAWRYFAAATIGVLPSITTALIKETWGLVVNEAFNQALPMIASDAVGAAAGGLLRHGETGLVVAERDPAALAGAIDQLLADPALRARIGRSAAQEVAAWHNERMVDGFAAAIASVIPPR
jgi:glycosyltransferase involved in cell wall biosynthesis